jgi:hypothetical protein
MILVPDSFGAQLQEFNPCHEPGGSDRGGQFAKKGSCGSASTHRRPDAVPRVQEEADAYTRQLGLKAPQHGHYVDIDQPRAGRLADLYDALPADDTRNPEVTAAYAALARELQAQWAFATARGMRFEPWTKDGQPYQTSAEMAADVRDNQRLFFYTGGESHPLLGARDPKTGHTLNDMFRAIHDYYGHAAGGYGFGPRGEENAWMAHSQMFTWAARRALTTETRGQNSWVNFGRHNYHADGTPKNIPPPERPFARQKVALLPDEYVRMPNEKKTRESKTPPKPFVRKPVTLDERDELPYRRRP